VLAVAGHGLEEGLGFDDAPLDEEVEQPGDVGVELGRELALLLERGLDEEAAVAQLLFELGVGGHVVLGAHRREQPGEVDRRGGGGGVGRELRCAVEARRRQRFRDGHAVPPDGGVFVARPLTAGHAAARTGSSAAYGCRAAPPPDGGVADGAGPPARSGSGNGVVRERERGRVTAR
jgi:hypothetical protein